MPVLETERLVLRDFALGDWEALNAFLSDPDVIRFMHFASWDEAKRHQWLTRMVDEASDSRRDAFNWAITLRGSADLIGWLILGRSRHATEEGMRDCGCGYALAQPYWGHGYMPEAVRTAFAYAFESLGNTASARVMQKCGIAFQGMVYNDDGLGNFQYRYRYVIRAGAGNPR
jgi:RimJ/RimL family protein N-acetyltransferase